MLIHKIDSGYYRGESREIDDAAGIPQGWTDHELPELAAGQVAAWAGRWVATAPPAPPHPTLDEYKAAVWAVLDRKAQERQYFNILSLCSYAASGNQQYAAEAMAGISWRDAACAYCYETLAEVEAGSIPWPTIDEFAAGLPAMEWSQ